MLKNSSEKNIANDKNFDILAKNVAPKMFKTLVPDFNGLYKVAPKDKRRRETDDSPEVHHSGKSVNQCLKVLVISLKNIFRSHFSRRLTPFLKKTKLLGVDFSLKTLPLTATVGRGSCSSTSARGTTSSTSLLPKRRERRTRSGTVSRTTLPSGYHSPLRRIHPKYPIFKGNVLT